MDNYSRFAQLSSIQSRNQISTVTGRDIHLKKKKKDHQRSHAWRDCILVFLLSDFSSTWTITRDLHNPLIIERTVTQSDIAGYSLGVLEYVQVTLTLSHPVRGMLEIYLQCPSGTSSVIGNTVFTYFLHIYRLSTLKWRDATQDFTFMFWIIANDCTCVMIYQSKNAL